MTAKEVLITLQQQLTKKHTDYRGEDIAFDQNENYIDVQPLEKKQMDKLLIPGASTIYSQYFIATRKLMGSKVFDFVGVNAINSDVVIIESAILNSEAEINSILGVE